MQDESSRWNVSLKALISGLLVASASLLSACLAALPEYSKARSDSCAVVSTDPLISVGVDPFDTPDICRRYFGSDLSREMILPVYVHVENHSRDMSVLIDPSEFVAFDGGRSSPGIPSGLEGRKSGPEKLVGALGDTIVLLPVAMVCGLGKLDAEEARRNVARKQLGVRTVSPSSSINGFVFIQLKEQPTERNIILELHYREMASEVDRIVQLAIPLKMERVLEPETNHAH